MYIYIYIYIHTYTQIMDIVCTLTPCFLRNPFASGGIHVWRLNSDNASTMAKDCQGSGSVAEAYY